MTYLRDVLQLSSGVRRFILSEALLGIGIGIFSLVLNLHLLYMGINEAEIGQLSSMGVLITGLVAIPFGLLANRFGRKKLLVLGLALMGVGYALFALGTTLVIFYFAQFIQSIGLTLLITTEIQLLFHYCQSKQEETQSYSLLFAVFTLFTGVGTLLGGFLPRWFEIGRATYQGSLLLAAVVLFVIAFVRGIWLPKEEWQHPNTDHVEKSTVSNRRRWMPSRSIWILSLFLFISGMTFAFVGPFLNVIVKFRFQWTDEWVSLLLMVNGFFLFIGSLAMPYILNRFGISKAYLYVFVMNILLTLLLFLALPTAILACILLLRGGFFILLTNMIESQSMSAVDEGERNLYAGMRSVSRSLGSAIATYIAGIILATKNYTLPFLLAAIAIMLSYIYFLFWVRPLLMERLNEKKQVE